MSIGALSASSGYPSPAHSVPPVQVAASAQTAQTAQSTPSTPSASTKLSNEALALIDQLKARDLEVRQHEQAHMAAAGGLATSGASYTYQRGPNGVDYAIGGEVNIDTSPGATPEETIERARAIQAAALAPAEPSGPDRAVATQAQQMEMQARAELAQRAYDSGPPATPSVDIFA
ncbi:MULTISPECIES: putative metalloprotease CJM1_0395 family protein [unclassified Duganella]|uniref:putative metalloprotease CJM1_0395 family protein n=1 Tax=unclassified Duganella TaxID=2636909 RepID=UPI00087F9A17|nr:MULTISPECIES: putative metalloprotease CJM1_0395 family protein [unclassified Duganella]SDF54775.1 SprA-related family protein [Duganella sp. OV458]SDI72836.1 SprA-related family protein [Duganella sp. OV510]